MNRPAIPLVMAAVITAVAVFFALKLQLFLSFDALLPENRPSVVELNRVAQRTAGVSTLFVVLQAGPSTSTEALRKAADALVPEIAKLGPPWVGSVEDGLHDAARFVKPRAGLYGDKAKLEKLRDDVEARFTYEVDKARGSLIDDSDPPPAIDAKKVRETLRRQRTTSRSATPTATTSRRTARRSSSPSAPR